MYCWTVGCTVVWCKVSHHHSSDVNSLIILFVRNSEGCFPTSSENYIHNHSYHYTYMISNLAYYIYIYTLSTYFTYKQAQLKKHMCHFVPPETICSTVMFGQCFHWTLALTLAKRQRGCTTSAPAASLLRVLAGANMQWQLRTEVKACLGIMSEA